MKWRKPSLRAFSNLRLPKKKKKDSDKAAKKVKDNSDKAAKVAVKDAKKDQDDGEGIRHR